MKHSWSAYCLLGSICCCFLKPRGCPGGVVGGGGDLVCSDGSFEFGTGSCTLRSLVRGVAGEPSSWLSGSFPSYISRLPAPGDAVSKNMVSKTLRFMPIIWPLRPIIRLSPWICICCLAVGSFKECVPLRGRMVWKRQVSWRYVKIFVCHEKGRFAFGIFAKCFIKNFFKGSVFSVLDWKLCLKVANQWFALRNLLLVVPRWSAGIPSVIGR